MRGWTRGLMGLLVGAALLSGCTSYEPRTWSSTGGGGTGGPGGTHVVRSGESVTAIAAAYGVSPSALIAVNGLSNPNRILVGQRLRIPGGSAERPTLVMASTTAASRPPVSNRATSPVATARATLPQTPPPREAVPETVPETRLASLTSSPAPRPTPARITPATKAQLPTTTARPSAVPVAPADPKAVREAATAKPPPLTGDGFMWPVSGTVVQSFGPKANGQRNDGINIKAPEGTPVVAAENGIVVFSGDSIAGFGNMLLIRHAGGFTTAYAHNEALMVTIGQTVKRGQMVAKVGSSGAVTTPQLHFELRAGRKAIDPVAQLTDHPPRQYASRD